MNARRAWSRGTAGVEVPLGVESAFPHTEQPRLARIDEDRPRNGLFNRAISWWRNARRRSGS